MSYGHIMMYHDEHWWTLMSHRIWVAILLGHQLWKRGLFGFSLARSSAKRRSFFHVERATMNPLQTRPGFRDSWRLVKATHNKLRLKISRRKQRMWHVVICRNMSQYVTMTWLSRKPLQQDPAGSSVLQQRKSLKESERSEIFWDLLNPNWA